MAHGEYAECPKCGRIALGKEKIEELFGFRCGGKIPQSWCRTCRTSENHSLKDKNESSKKDNK